jgi:aspartyl-tRNA(Asn)/glutamyl-tRNA(Gln) amidotransferase subunit C
VTDTPDLAHVDVRYVAALARIALTDAEAERFQGELDDILEYVAQLNELDVSGIEPTAHAVPRVNVMRDDRIADSLDRDRVLANAPRAVGESHLRVPPVFEEGAP